MEMAQFETGANRTADTGKLDYEGGLSPIVLKRYMEYMTKHRQLPNGKTREADNWQLGIPIKNYMKSLYRHFMDVHMIYDGYKAFEHGQEINIEEALCAVLFNSMGMLHETLKAKEKNAV
jgi:hypothetical protein